jgi:hypothetical protein
MPQLARGGQKSGWRRRPYHVAVHKLVALERAGWDALCTSEGVRFYDRLMADEAVMVFPMGVFDRSGSLDAIRSAAPWTSYELESVTVTEPTPAVGVVTYHATATRNGHPYEAWMTSVYVRDSGGDWRLALHQQSPR